jgi:hypothetical protein
LVFYIGYNDLTSLDTDKNIPNNVFDQVVKHYKFLNLNNEEWNVENDFHVKPNSVMTPELAQKNIDIFTQQVDDQISILKDEIKKAPVTTENNLKEIQKLEIAKAEAKNNNIFKVQSLDFINKSMLTPE